MKLLNRLFMVMALAASAGTAVSQPLPPGDVARPGQIRPDERVVNGVNVRTEATTASAPLDQLEPGETATLRRELPGWYEIALPDGRIGFVSKAWTVPVLPDNIVYRLHAIDVGTGLALFAEGPGFTLLYDAGSQDDTRGGDANRVLAYLRKVRPDLTAIDHLILSHPHKDHLELLPEIFDRYTVKNVYDSGTPFDRCGYRTFLLKVAAEPGVAYHAGLAAGPRQLDFQRCAAEPRQISVRVDRTLAPSTIPLGPGASLTFLNVDPTLHHDPNENSLVVRLDMGGRRFLLTGDAEGGERREPASAADPGSIEADLLACCLAALRADVLIAGHHGSKTSSRATFLEAVGARTFVISSGPYLYSGTGLPDAEIVTLMSSKRSLYRTDADDTACRTAAAKVGVDADGKVGGCDNVMIGVTAGRALVAAYNRIAD